MSTGDASVLFGSEQTLVVTQLHSLASSPTAGWQSAVQTTPTPALDILVQVVLDFANTAPANSKAALVFAYAGLVSTYTNPASGAEGTITLPDVTANRLNLPLLGMMPYNIADEVVESTLFSLAAAFGGILPPKWGIAIINHSGAALAASGNTVKWMAAYANVSP